MQASNPSTFTQPPEPTTARTAMPQEFAAKLVLIQNKDIHDNSGTLTVDATLAVIGTHLEAAVRHAYAARVGVPAPDRSVKATKERLTAAGAALVADSGLNNDLLRDLLAIAEAHGLGVAR